MSGKLPDASRPPACRACGGQNHPDRYMSTEHHPVSGRNRCDIQAFPHIFRNANYFRWIIMDRQCKFQAEQT